MSNKGLPTIVENDVIVSMKYELSVDGEVIDTSEDSGLTEFIHGRGQVLPGLEKHLLGMKIGEEKHIRLSPSEGYGEHDSELVIDFAKSEFPPEIPLIPGIEIEIEDDEGEISNGVVIDVDEDSVTVDFNDPLAGKDLDFHVSIVDLRYPTQGELECGCVHCDECQDLDCSGEEDCL